MIRRPDTKTLQIIAESLSLQLSAADLDFFAGNMDAALQSYDLVADLPDDLPPLRYPRSPATWPTDAENPLNAWYVRTDIGGAASGALAGRTVAIKDNIAVAGVPMMNGALALQGYVPDADATVVTRLLDAGAIITGKAQCEYYCLSGGSHTGSQGPVQNPHKPGHSTAGSSSGCAALVASGAVDMAIGGDQGGSIRTPASYCGIVGMKPTWGLVPYTGAMPIEATLDHLGPMTRTVADNALMLAAIAGFDGLDPRQTALARSQDYSASLTLGCKGMRIGILTEGFGHANSELDVEATVHAAAQQFRKLGAEVTMVSVPMHRIAPDIWKVIAFEGATAQMMKGGSHGYGWKGLYTIGMIEAHHHWPAHAANFPDTVKSTLLIGEYAMRIGGGSFYAKAQNLGRKLTAVYDAALAQVDLLLMPTTPMKAPPLPPQGATRDLSMQRATENMGNTFAFDITGHPALSLPCGTRDGLPIGMMLVARHFDEPAIYRAAQAYELSGDWREHG